MLPIETKNPMFGKYIYVEAKDIMELQQSVTWTAMEIPVEADKQDYLINMTEAQYGLCKTTLQTFVEIEQSVGEIWHVVGTWFPHSEIEGATATIEFIEKGVHAFFYQKMSDVLNIEPEETYRIQTELGPIRDKLTYMEEIFINPSENKPLTLAVVTMVEQVLLFGNFAMLKSFKANGYNMIPNTLFGVDYVIADEQLHGDLSAYLFKTYLQEADYTEEQLSELYKEITNVLDMVIHHEIAVINMVFVGVEEINKVTAEDLTAFVLHRANMVIDNLNVPLIKYPVVNSNVQDWFYDNINAVKMHDFFAGGTTSYRKDWAEAKFSRIAIDKL